MVLEWSFGSMCGVGIVSLKRLFQIFTGLVLSKARNSLVAKVMCWSGRRIHWNFHFHRSPQDWEEDSFNRFMDIFYSSKVRGVGPDKVYWKLARIRGFEVKGFYFSFYPPILSFTWRLVWQLKVPPRVAFFSWSALLGMILTTDDFRKRCIIGLDLYYMCKRCKESVDHLLLHFPIAFELWSLVFCMFGLDWVMPHKVFELFESWQGKFGQHHNIDFRRLVPHYLMWCIWSERNARCFEGCEQSLLEIKSFFLHTLLTWVWLCRIFLVYLLLGHCNFGSWFLPHSTSSMYSSWLFFS